MATVMRRKRIVPTIKDTVNILTLIDKFVSYTVIVERYGIGRSNVSDIRNNRER